ncbi:MAG TPA: SDR family NAD(P)-dependent oxidoreductase [Pseudonocardiaceae bacterium]|nr:SDR family NAD(P)-dependent oxidoreductase [Pseudonocardiaceae bacterium]
MNPTYDFTGQVALVTGVGSGMGLVTARAFAEAGAAVVLADIDDDALRRAAEGVVCGSRCCSGQPCQKQPSTKNCDLDAGKDNVQRCAVASAAVACTRAAVAETVQGRPHPDLGAGVAGSGRDLGPTRCFR